MIRIKALFLLIALMTFVSSNAQNNLLSVKELQEDFKILRNNLEDVHGALYLYTSKETIDKEFENISSKLNQPMSELEFFQLLTPLHGLIQNGHTEIAPSKMFFDSIRHKAHTLPFDLYHHEGNIYILKNNSLDSTIQAGSRLLKVNGKDAMELVTELSERMTRDGENRTMPIERIVRNFNTRYLFYYPELASYKCEIETTEGNSKTYDVKALLIDEIIKNRNQRYGAAKPNFWSTKDPAYTLVFKDDIAIMTLKTFSKSEVRKRDKRTKKWFKESFAEIEKRNPKKLIIDLRDNGGGDPEPTIELFSHLHPESFTFYKAIYTDTKKIRDGKLYDENIFLLNLYASLITKKNGNRYDLKTIAGMKPYKAAKEQYAGPVDVLINAFSFSATGEMSAILKEHNRVRFIGQETGGNPNQNTSGVSLPLHLPNSKLRVFIPLVIFEMNVNFPNTRRGVIPDVPMKNSIEDELKGYDSVMNFALEN